MRERRESYDGHEAGCPPRVNFETCKQSCSGHACICPAKMPVGVTGQKMPLLRAILY